MRPLLVWYSGLMFGEVSETLLQTTVAVELIHMASLIHDDLIDGSSFRRNQPTVHNIWGNHKAVLAGDYLFAKAFGILTDSNLIKSLNILAKVVETMCLGEIAQAGDEFNHQTNLEMYFNRITQKTAVLLEAACQVGAQAGKADETQVAAMGWFGRNLGLAYQIVDDILDICGDEANLGKPKYIDIIKGNLTLPMILILQQPEYSQSIKAIILEKAFTTENLRKIETAIRNSGVIHQSFRIAFTYLDKARTILNGFVESPARQFLFDLTTKLQTRAN